MRTMLEHVCQLFVQQISMSAAKLRNMKHEDYLSYYPRPVVICSTKAPYLNKASIFQVLAFAFAFCFLLFASACNLALFLPPYLVGLVNG